jgi:hypothetical protein
MTSTLLFNRKSVGLFHDYYLVMGDGSPYEIVWHIDTCGHGRSRFRGSDEEWQRDIVSGFNGVHRADGQAISAAVVDRFNEWRAAQQPGELAAGDEDSAERFTRLPTLPSAVPARGIRYDAATGWIEIDRLPPNHHLEVSQGE